MTSDAYADECESVWEVESVLIEGMGNIGEVEGAAGIECKGAESCDNGGISADA
jgi:hypothetical protein